MTLQQRDRRVRRFTSDFGCATTRQLHQLFFSDVSLRRCRDRLALLTDAGYLNRTRENRTSDYIYYVGKEPKEIDHMLARVDFYCEAQRYPLVEFAPEYQIGDVRADAYMEIWYNGFTLPFFVEVQLSPYFRQEKYERLYSSGIWLNKWSEFPQVILLSDNALRLKDGNVRYNQFPLKGGDLDVLLCDAGRDVCARYV